jgi:hypothetical protein
MFIEILANMTQVSDVASGPLVSIGERSLISPQLPEMHYKQS